MGHKDDIIKKLKKRIFYLEKLYGSDDQSGLYVDGDELGRLKKWEPLDCVVKKVKEVLNRAENHEWSWAYNWSCKYINIRIDMRDGHAILTNETGRISEDQLDYQWKEKENEPSQGNIDE